MSVLLPDLAEYLALLGHGVWDTDVPYPDGAVAILVGRMPSAPDRVIVLETYPSDVAPGMSNQPEVVEVVRIRYRGTPDVLVSARGCQAIHDDLHGRGHTRLPSGRQLLNSVAKQPTPMDMGADANNRHEHSTVVEIEHLHPSALRPA